MPLSPVPIPLTAIFRRVTTSDAPALTTIPLVPLTRIEARFPPPSMVIDFVIVTAPYPPGSSASISPPAAVFEIAPAKVLHGAVRLQGFASSPTPDTHVLVACALAAEPQIVQMASAATKLTINFFIRVISFLFVLITGYTSPHLP